MPRELSRMPDRRDSSVAGAILLNRAWTAVIASDVERTVFRDGHAKQVVESLFWLWLDHPLRNGEDGDVRHAVSSGPSMVAADGVARRCIERPYHRVED